MGQGINRLAVFCLNMQKFKRFIPIKKIDKDQRMVFGFASTPDLDSDGEIISLEAMKNALPGYMEFPTIREMHQPKAIGTTKTAEIIDDPKMGKGMWIGAKIVADDAWKLVKEGVLTAFSVAGHVIDKIDNVINAIDLVEISLVDVPANKAATIQVWKRESNPDINKIATALAELTKDSRTVISLSNLLMHLRDIKFTFEMRKKSVVPINRMIEQTKKLIAKEAEEKEPKPIKADTLRIRKIADNLTKIYLVQKKRG